jgi:DNA-directed RNA polymerase specialized sigma24 family protein
MSDSPSTNPNWIDDYPAHYAYWVRVAKRILREVGGAEDVVGECVVSFVECPEAYDASKGASVRSFIARRVIWRALNARRNFYRRDNLLRERRNG